MKNFILSSILIIASLAVQSQPNKLETVLKQSHFRIFGGALIGGSTPLPIPSEIQQIKGYSPEFNGMIGISATHWWDARHGLRFGISIENKGMRSTAQVKSYQTEIVYGDNKVVGFWTGQVDTRIKITYLSLPIHIDYKLSEQWKLHAGAYFSLRLNGNFSGEVSQGYLRERTPTGQMIEFKDEQYASYNFSDNLNNIGYGLQIGADWKAIERLHLFAQLQWGLNDIFKSDFETISFAMYPIYLGIGVAYQF